MTMTTADIAAAAYAAGTGAAEALLAEMSPAEAIRSLRADPMEVAGALILAMMAAGVPDACSAAILAGQVLEERLAEAALGVPPLGRA